MNQLSFDDLAAFNDELLALTRAGVPLHLGLAASSAEMTRSLSKAMTTIADDMEAGAPLEESIRRSKQFPELYRALIQIGARTGRLTAALESSATALNRIQDVRQTLAAAIVYPIAIVSLAYAMLVMSLAWASPSVIAALADAGVTDVWWLPLLRWLANYVWIWATVIPLLLGLVIVAWYFRTRATYLSRAWNNRYVRWGRMACVMESLAMLLSSEVPLGQALCLAAEAFGDERAIRECQQFEQRLEQGEDVTASDFPQCLPPLARWLIANQSVQRDLPAALRDLGEQYHSRAIWQARWYRHALPVWLTATVGGTATMLYATVVIGPWLYLLWRYGVETF